MCVKGQFIAAAQHTVCTDCRLGKFGPESGKECRTCSDGMYTSQPGATVCSSCDMGRFVSAANETRCTPCPLGMYDDDETSTCTDCKTSSGHYTPTVGSTACSTCTGNTYASSQDGDSSCVPCPPSKVLSCDAGTLDFKRNAWYNIGQWKRNDQDELVWESANTEITEASIIYNCFNDVCCRHPVDGTPDGDRSRVECNTEFGYYGPLCGGCDKSRGFYRDGFKCAQCRSKSDNWTIVGMLALGAFCMLVYVSAFHRTKQEVGENGSIMRRIAYSYVQTLGVLGIFKARGTKIFYETVGKTSQAVGGSLTALLAIKCLMKSQIYGTFIFTMLLPGAGLITVCLILLPWTLWKRHKNKQKRVKDMERYLRRRSFAMATPEDDPFTIPTFEPIWNCPKFGGANFESGVPDKICRKIPCFRRPATEEYINNSERRWRGEYPLAPEYRPRCPVHENVMAGVARAALMSCACNRVPTTDAEKGVTRAERALLYQRIPYKPAGRLMAVMVLVMYSLFPSLVASTTSIFNCTDKILGRYYLVADLTVTCYDGWHLVYMLCSAVCVVVFCIGTPLLFTLIIVFDICSCTMRPKFKKEADLPEGTEISKIKKKGGLKIARCICNCHLRSDIPWGFRTSNMRERLGLLVVGYDVNRGSLVMAWEPMIGMTRKLLITLAGTLIRDPYIQIMTAQLILIFSLTLQATVQPYESRMLNFLDIMSILILVVTQILSILFLYLDTLEGPLPYESFGIDRPFLEVGMTVLLFFTNVGVIGLLYLAYVTIEICSKMPALCARGDPRTYRGSRSPMLCSPLHPPSPAQVRGSHDI